MKTHKKKIVLSHINALLTSLDRCMIATSAHHLIYINKIQEMEEN